MKCFSYQEGFSLIEVLVGLLLLSLGMAAGLEMMRAGNAGMETGRHLTTATGLARSKAEEMLAMRYWDLIEGEREGQETINGYTRIWTLKPGVPYDHLMEIEIVIIWKDSRGREHKKKVRVIRGEGVVP